MFDSKIPETSKTLWQVINIEDSACRIEKPADTTVSLYGWDCGERGKIGGGSKTS
jgi:hypothetical protein